MIIVEPDSVLEDNGRTHHGYKQGIHSRTDVVAGPSSP